MKFRTLRLLATPFIIMLILTGCGLKQDYITISYTPLSGVQRVNGADGVSVRVQVADERKTKEHVGRKGDEYNFLARIIAQDDLAGTVAKAIQNELQNRGFTLADGAGVVFVELIKAYNEFKGFPEKAVAELIMNVQVKKPDGSIIFAKSVTGEGINSGVMLRTGSNAKVALDAALKDAVSQLVNDGAFIGALLNLTKT